MPKFHHHDPAGCSQTREHRPPQTCAGDLCDERPTNGRSERRARHLYRMLCKRIKVVAEAVEEEYG